MEGKGIGDSGGRGGGGSALMAPGQSAGIVRARASREQRRERLWAGGRTGHEGGHEGGGGMAAGPVMKGEVGGRPDRS